MLFLPICLVSVTFCVGRLSAHSPIPVSGSLSSTVLLPCQLRTLSGTPYIRWSTDEDVFERSGNEFFQGEGYEGRVEVDEEQLRKGNCSLVLHNLTLADIGVYKSYQAVKRSKRSVREKWDLISSVELSVDVTRVSYKEEQRLPTPSNNGRVNWPQLPVMVLSLLSSSLFMKKT